MGKIQLRSLKSKLLLTVFILVVGSGLIVSLIISQRYSVSLREAMEAQAKNLAHSITLDLTDKILINDLVALQKLLDHQIHGHTSLAYLFVIRDDQVLAHTFGGGIPSDLLDANHPAGKTGRMREIASERGEHFIDVAWPVFEGKAGVLRLGFSEREYRERVTRLWIQMSLLTLGVLILACIGSLWFIGRITRPLTALAGAAQKVDRGEQGVRVEVQGADEVAQLALSFNHMVANMERYTQRLEEQTMELERSHHQTKRFCGIIREIGAQSTLGGVGAFLVKEFQIILDNHDMTLLVFNSSRDILFAFSEQGVKMIKDAEIVKRTSEGLQSLNGMTIANKPLFNPQIVTGNFDQDFRQTIVPFHRHGQIDGALVLTCPSNCGCEDKELDLVQLTLDQAAGTIHRAILHEEEIHNLKHRVETTAEFSGIIGKNPKLQVIYKLIEDVAPTDATVLIQGESGTGKELVARAIHRLSPRKDAPFVVINCSAYPTTLLESELFGHEKGAFTGAVRQKPGRFELADRGTVFLDEIGEIPLSAQIKLLRVLQTQSFERLGGEKTLTVDVRVLAATNKDLLEGVKNGSFREDLFYRLNVIPINLPPLRERRNDIPLLANHFLRKFSIEQNKNLEGISSEAMRLLLDYHWPGNVRELENSIEHAVILAKGGRIEPAQLPSVLLEASASPGTPKPLTIHDHEARLLQETMEECGWNKKEAAKRLSISRSTLYEKLRKYRISKPTTH